MKPLLIQHPQNNTNNSPELSKESLKSSELDLTLTSRPPDPRVSGIAEDLIT